MLRQETDLWELTLPSSLFLYCYLLAQPLTSLLDSLNHHCCCEYNKEPTCKGLRAC